MQVVKRMSKLCSREKGPIKRGTGYKAEAATENNWMRKKCTTLTLYPEASKKRLTLVHVHFYGNYRVPRVGRIKDQRKVWEITASEFAIPSCLWGKEGDKQGSLVTERWGLATGPARSAPAWHEQTSGQPISSQWESHLWSEALDTPPALVSPAVSLHSFTSPGPTYLARSGIWKHSLEHWRCSTHQESVISL